jgi:hypothetical protein
VGDEEAAGCGRADGCGFLKQHLLKRPTTSGSADIGRGGVYENAEIIFPWLDPCFPERRSFQRDLLRPLDPTRYSVAVGPRQYGVVAHRLTQ